MPRSLLLTGTDTGIGKTTVACALGAALAKRGRRVGVSKPVETGCRKEGDALIPEDAVRLKFFSECGEPLDAVCPYRFRSPLAPAVAARLEKAEIDMRALVAGVNRIAGAHEITLVEGAGGLLVPISGAFTFADLASQCALPLLVVVGNRLGAINHALLTIRWAKSAGLEVAGYVLNSLGPESDLAAETNVAVLAELLGPPLAVFPWLGGVECNGADRQRLAGAIENAADLDRLF